MGSGKGRKYSINFPMREGIDDESYASVFRPVRGDKMCGIHDLVWVIMWFIGVFMEHRV